MRTKLAVVLLLLSSCTCVALVVEFVFVVVYVVFRCSRAREMLDQETWAPKPKQYYSQVSKRQILNNGEKRRCRARGGAGSRRHPRTHPGCRQRPKRAAAGCMMYLKHPPTKFTTIPLRPHPSHGYMHNAGRESTPKPEKQKPNAAAALSPFTSSVRGARRRCAGWFAPWRWASRGSNCRRRRAPP